MLFLGLVALGGGSAWGADLAPFLMQTVCLDTAGVVLPGLLPFEPGCERQRPLYAGEPLPWRKHDWPARPGGPALGYQASDSLRGIHGFIQSFDFGDRDRAFGRFDAGRGDGGQLLVLRDGAAFILLTEGGAGGLQWFLDPDCQAGWLLAEPEAGPDWRSRIARLRAAPAENACPRGFDAAFTRWRLAPLVLPWREAATGATASISVPVLVSEHYGGEAIATADHLERFFFTPGLSLVRWECWEQRRRSRVPQLEARAARLAASGRCPALAQGGPPERDWLMVDCRTWTNFERGTAQEPLEPLTWPAAR